MIPKSKIEEAARSFGSLVGAGVGIIECANCAYDGFYAGVSFAEKELENLAIEFAEWLVGEGWVQAETYNTFKNVYHANIEENVRLTTQELFEIFKQENYESNK